MYIHIYIYIYRHVLPTYVSAHMNMCTIYNIYIYIHTHDVGWTAPGGRRTVGGGRQTADGWLWNMIAYA